jgi:alpha-amylase/alpha-mannosidase (GH57 family)
MMKNWDFWDYSRCPCCDHVHEDKIHLLTCPHPDSNETWQESLLGLEAWMIDTDTDVTIRECILLSLETRDPTQTFTTYSNPRSFQAAQAQDRIGWMNTTEGKLSRQWQQLQAEHYKSIDSPRSASKWAAGLVTNLLGITHSQWLHRCAVLHERDTQGLKLKDSQQLAAAIQEQFLLGLDGLQARDCHFITRGQATVNALPADNKQAWLSGIRIARQLYHDSETREIDGMRTFMLHWLSAPD